MVGKSKTEDTKSLKSVSGDAKTPERLIKSAKPKSPARPKSPGRTKSPGRPKSPARAKSPAKQKSPARKILTDGVTPEKRPRGRPKSLTRVAETKSKSPTRKSPSRTTPPRNQRESSATKRLRVDKVVLKKIPKLELDSDSDGGDPFETRMEKPKAAVRGRTRRLDIDNYEREIEEVKEVTTTYREMTPQSNITRRSSKVLPEERVVHLKTYETFTKLAEFSDDESFTQKSKLTNNELYSSRHSKINYGRRIEALSCILFMPVFFFVIYMMCNEDQCSFTKIPNFQKYKNLSVFFDLLSFFVIIGYSLITAILSAIPFGGRKVRGVINRQGKVEYVMNGILSSVILVGATVVLECYNIPVSDFLRTKYLQLYTASVCIGILISIGLYVRSFFIPISALNPNADTNDGVYNFVMGRETNPRIFGVLDMKMYLTRYTTIAILIINTCIIMENLVIKEGPLSISDPINLIKSLSINPTLLSIVMMQTVYFLDLLIFEHTLTTTFEILYEGIGYIFCLEYIAGPFIYTHIIKYVADYNVQLSNIQLGLTFIPYILGYILYRGSNLQKDIFRQNPYDPRVAHLESIPTGQGKKLLVSGYWGFVRHPNYLGDILMYLSWVPFTVCYPSVILPCVMVLFFVHRSMRVGKRCREHYGPSWERYCNRVKYVLIPKIY